MKLSQPVNRVRYALNYIQEEYEFIELNMMQGEHQQEAYRKINPFGKVPAIEDGDVKLFESNAILRYIADKNNKTDLYPKELKARANVDQWLDFATAQVQPAMVRITFNTLFADMVPGMQRDDESIKAGRGFMANYLPVIDRQLQENKYLTGDKMTIADFSLLASLDPAESVQLNLEEFENITRWRNESMSQDWYTKCHKSYQEEVNNLMAAMA